MAGCDGRLTARSAHLASSNARRKADFRDRL